MINPLLVSVLFPRATMSERKAVIKNADMSEDMQQDAVECATQALEKYNIEKDIAAYIKKVRLTHESWFTTNTMASSSMSSGSIFTFIVTAFQSSCI